MAFCKQHFQMYLFGWKYLYFEISLKYAPKSPINKKLSSVQIMACCHTDYKPLFLILVQIIKHISNNMQISS